MDIDIDVSDRNKILQELPCLVNASIITNKVDKHPSGVYLQNIPVLENGMSSLDYKKAEHYGYLKVDLLNNSLYENIKSKDELDDLVNEEPNWEILEYAELVNELPHLRDHFDIVQKIKPSSIDDLAVVIALIRPGKRYLLDCSRSVIDENIWKKEDSYYFKKSHAYAYALSIIVKMNLLLK